MIREVPLSATATGCRHCRTVRHRRDASV